MPKYLKRYQAAAVNSFQVDFCVRNLKTTMKSARGLSRLYKVYHDLLTKHPVKVQSIQTAILCGTGDIIAQTAIEKKKFNEFDIKRFTSFFAFGGIFVGPTLRMWFGILDTKVKGNHYAVVAQKVLLDQCIMAPILLLLTLSVLNICAGKSLAELKEKLGADYGNILITNYKVINCLKHALCHKCRMKEEGGNTTTVDYMNIIADHVHSFMTEVFSNGNTFQHDNCLRLKARIML
ncbi:protein Mpv17-like isoform X2 [Schistocerca nitens]|nr:protein Mpv17-like isoform X2 [Schistocerca nitens]XP_049800694.1 protein Mpv17-like isoform X2 [Schistocerca nitens]